MHSKWTKPSLARETRWTTHLIASTLLFIGFAMNPAHAKSMEAFRWGAASAAYQVEGATTADNKGTSIWDVYLDEKHLAGPGVSGKQAINFYDRTQYLKDIAIFKQSGFTSYRFSIAWSRIIPAGLGPVNPAAIAHYRQFIDDLKAAGIKPMLTLYHWDMPAGLAAAGGWENRDSIEWFKHYAEVIFANFHEQVDLYVLMNEPSVERAAKTAATKLEAGERFTPGIFPDDDHLAVSLKTFNHILLAAAAAKKSFDAAGYKGRLGLALPLFPAIPADEQSAEDIEAAKIGDAVLNRWFLDPLYKGTYPAEILSLAKDRKLDIGVRPDDASTIAAAHLDYVGVNYYAPLFYRRPKVGRDKYAAETFTPEGIDAAFNGAVRPDLFEALLDRIRTEYGNPIVYITENGAGFPGEDTLVNGQVRDMRRCRYLIAHIAAMKRAIKAGADVRGYHVWSSHDNLEWFSGYSSRFGLIYVDYDTQRRTPKLSLETYTKIIKGAPVSDTACQD